MIEAAARFDGMAQNALKNSINTIIENSSKENNTCTLENLRVRRNWRAFTPTEKKSYIKSVLCLITSQSITPPHLARGVRSRFDDFVAVHINQSYHIHRDVSLNTARLFKLLTNYRASSLHGIDILSTNMNKLYGMNATTQGTIRKYIIPSQKLIQNSQIKLGTGIGPQTPTTSKNPNYSTAAKPLSQETAPTSPTNFQ